jgi:hypothetical protein
MGDSEVATAAVAWFIDGLKRQAFSSNPTFKIDHKSYTEKS